jgi:hypothetical protein
LQPPPASFSPPLKISRNTESDRESERERERERWVSWRSKASKKRRIKIHYHHLFAP